MKTIKILAFTGFLAMVSVLSANRESLSNPNIMTDNNYKMLWQKVDSLKDSGMPKAALEFVDQIQRQAAAEKNHPESIKALLYDIRLRSEFEEDHLENSIKKVEEAISRADMPAFSVLNSIQAELYFRYFTANRHTLLDRTTGRSDHGSDIKTWDATAILKKAAFHYLESVKDTDELKKTPAGFFSAILDEKEESKIYRPSLFDLLGHRALDFFMNPQASLIQPHDPLALNKDNHFGEAAIFANEVLEKPQELSFNYHALELFRQLIGFHLHDSSPLALVDVDIKRLQWLRDNSLLENKNELLMRALVFLEEKYHNTDAFPDVAYAIARELHREGSTYHPYENPGSRLKLKQAVEKLEMAIERFPKIPATQNCRNLLQQITQPHLQFQLGSVNLPETPFKALVSHKNVQTIHLRLIKTEPEKDQELKNTHRRPEDLVSAYMKLEPYKTWQQELPDDGDMQTHNTEIALAALPAGYYIIIGSTDRNFSRQNRTLPYTSFWVSNLSFLSRRHEDGSIEYLVLDRENGKPLRGVKATTYIREYNQQSRQFELKERDTYRTSRDGSFIIPAPKRGETAANYIIEFSQRNDRLFSDNFFTQQRMERQVRMRTRTHFFTDRSIYRPGQTVYFKGIVIESEGDKNEVKTNFRTTVILYDANRRNIAQLSLTTNEFGSFAGQFVLPSEVLTGTFMISEPNGSASFSVEEYKLPQFEVTFDTLAGSYKLGEELTINGRARAYAGNPIPDAEVIFRVTRQARFPFFERRGMDFIQPGPPTEILNGTLTTDEGGMFTITFNAVPDLLLPRDHNPVFIFNISAAVTDIHGETQSGSTSVGVGYKALLLNTGLDRKVNRDKTGEFQINATNLNGVPQEVSGELTISKLKQPERILRERNHTRPDRFVMEKTNHDKLFPYDIYDNEDDPFTWEPVSRKLNTSFNTGNTSVVNLPEIENWEPGVYLVEMKSRDAFGESVEYKEYFTLFSPSDRRIPENKLWWAQVLTPKAEAGENAEILIGSADRLSVLYQIEIDGKVVSTQRLNLNRRTQLIEIPLSDKHKGDFRVLFTSVSRNRAYAEAFTITVPDREKELLVELETIRSKLNPGSGEQWNILIKDHKGNPVTAEMLAGMYDAALDALKTHNWVFALHQPFQRRFNWETGHAFDLRSGTASFRLPHIDRYIREYDRLNWFGFDMHWMPYRDFRRGDVMYAAPVMAEEGMLEAKGMPDAGEEIKREEIADQAETAEAMMPSVMIRRDFRETAFFYPQLISDASGSVKVSFTLPESLTRWRLLGLAHTRDLKTGSLEAFFEASREVMVMANAPRFFRKGDQMDFRAKVANTTDETLEAAVKLELFDAITMEPVHTVYGLSTDATVYEIPAKGAVDMEWTLNIPEKSPYAIVYRVTAVAGKHSDGEEKMVPVLTNRQLLTESMPMFARAGENRTFSLDKLQQTGRSGNTAINHQLVLEFTSNPVWYAVQAIPYLTEPVHRNATALFHQFYANKLASYIIDDNPEIERVFEVWRKIQPDALLSNLEKNEDLKNIVLEETPWVRDAVGESERKRQIALLFNRNTLSHELENNLKALMDMQLGNGGWPWFPGMRDNRFVTQEIIAGLGRLQALGALNIENDPLLNRQISHGVQYLDERLLEEYRKIEDPTDPKINVLNPGIIQYLWARSYWLEKFPPVSKIEESFNFWRSQAEKHWTGQNLYLQGMIALSLHRSGEKNITQQIMRSFSDRALYSDEFGMYWRDLWQGYNWHQAPIEAQSMLIEAYASIAGDMDSVEKMQQWLITQKRTQAWKSNRATAEAVYAILMRGKQSLAPNRELSVKIGEKTLRPADDPSIREEAGSGYFRLSWHGGEIKPEMANITVNNPGNSIAWGGLYWQYFEQLDRITPHETPLKLNRSIMREILTPSGPVLEPVQPESPLRIGDKMVMRIELRVDRDMEYIHMKDLRAPAFEPTEQISGYKHQGGLGYYESPRDAATHFFFQYLPRGTWVFEYPVVVSQSGNFSTGITSIQSLYAPEFTSHSEGIRVNVE